MLGDSQQEWVATLESWSLEGFFRMRTQGKFFSQLKIEF